MSKRKIFFKFGRAALACSKGSGFPKTILIVSM